MDLDKVDYIFNYFGGLMTSNESTAWRHYSSQYKIDKGNSRKESKIARLKIYYQKGWMTKDPEILKLLENGIKAFRLNTAQRILKENKKEVVFNTCPKCNKLARTPKAKQCRFCGHDWH